MKKIIAICLILVCALGAFSIFRTVVRYARENKILKEVISRLEADSRIAEALVTNVYFDETSKKTHTTIKFLEYDSKGKPLTPMYFTFPGNIIQFQSLVVRFDDIYIRNKDALKGKSAYLFWKVFMLDGRNTMEYEITKLNQIPAGYKIQGKDDPFEKKLWEKFWSYALDPKESKKIGIKNAQIEAPGTMFIPGTLYTIKIEHDGGIRIDAAPLPEIIKGERIPAD
ncbi:MAG: hypothetical protein FJZ10_05985 [Candidatus Omnitrophica bacterium]|nr:hypothetical protein [Candidatus Omnitrophota bacterium]